MLLRVMVAMIGWRREVGLIVLNVNFFSSDPEFGVDCELADMDDTRLE
jgi:hypothetical protein